MDGSAGNYGAIQQNMPVMGLQNGRPITVSEAGDSARARLSATR
ncbi:MAG: hypothetical protein WB797_00115 [Nocardioides sp.]